MLRDALPEIIDRTIAHVGIIAQTSGDSQLFLSFSDETHCQLYDIDSMSGARGTYAGGRDALLRSAEGAGCLTVCSPPSSAG